MNAVMKAIESRKKADAAYQVMDQVIMAERKVLQMAHFEQTTGAKIEKRIKQEQMDKARRGRTLNLAQRQSQLANLYNIEMEEWRKEVLNNVETIEERKNRIMEKAYSLRDKRESERLAFVSKCYNEQWREACDDARTLDSKALVTFIKEERLQQIKNKQERNERLNADDTEFLAQCQKIADDAAAKEKAKQERRQKADHDTQAEILEHIEYNRRNMEDHYNRAHEEQLQDIQRNKEDIARAAAKEKNKSDELRQRGKKILEYNAQFKVIKDEEARIDREQDAILLEYALRKERERIAEEEAAKHAYKEAAHRYRKYLEEQMIREAEDNSFVDEINRKESEKVWKAREDALQAREDARNYLMKLVDEGRQEQLKAKAARSIDEREHDKIFAKKFIEDAKEGIQAERDAAERRRKLAEYNNSKLMEQIALRKHKEELERQEVYLADKSMKHMEKLHSQKLQTQAGQVRLWYGLKANNMH